MLWLVFREKRSVWLHASHLHHCNQISFMYSCLLRPFLWPQEGQAVPDGLFLLICTYFVLLYSPYTNRASHFYSSCLVLQISRFTTRNLLTADSINNICYPWGQIFRHDSCWKPSCYHGGCFETVAGSSQFVCATNGTELFIWRGLHGWKGNRNVRFDFMWPPCSFLRDHEVSRMLIQASFAWGPSEHSNAPTGKRRFR